MQCAEDSCVLYHDHHAHQYRRSDRYSQARADVVKGEDVQPEEQAAAEGDQHTRVTRLHGTFATTYWIS
jgi:hypothetical protein